MMNLVYLLCNLVVAHIVESARGVVGTQTRGFGSLHARNGRYAAVTCKITVGVRGNDAQRAKA